jgi:hypothetical protein
LDDGWVLKVTHKEFRVVHAVSAEVKADIREQLSRKHWAHLRLAALLSKSALGILGSKSDIVEFLAGVFEDKLLAKYSDSMQLRELKSPVTTFVSHGVIRTMESTAERNIQEELSDFDVEEALDEIFENAELTDEDVDGRMEGQEGERPS